MNIERQLISDPFFGAMLFDNTDSNQFDVHRDGIVVGLFNAEAVCLNHIK